MAGFFDALYSAHGLSNHIDTVSITCVKLKLLSYDMTSGFYLGSNAFWGG